MNREDLITKVSDGLNFHWPDVARIWDAAMEDVLLEKAEGARILWPYFGRFEWYMRKARPRKHPKKGTVYVTPAKLSLRFVPMQYAKDKVAGRI